MNSSQSFWARVKCRSIKGFTFNDYPNRDGNGFNGVIIDRRSTKKDDR